MADTIAKVAVITGASGGIGAEVARRFAQGGYRLALGARRTDRLNAQVRSIKAIEPIETMALDMASGPSVDNFVKVVLDRFGRVDTLVNCAGLAIGREPVELGNLEEWRQMVETDYFGPMTLIRALLPKMKEKTGGHIINIGALAALFPHPGSAVYASAKEGIRMFMRCLREDLLGSGVRVTNIDPGITRTDFALTRFRGNAEAVGKLLEGFTPLEPADVAECVWFAASLPPHVNIDQLTVTPTDQANPTRLHKRP